MPEFIQFMHPGGQPNFGTSSQGALGWNLTTKPHYRKFLQGNGDMVDSSGGYSSGIVYFWGEWEPDSTFTAIPGAKLPSPKAINIPTVPIQNRTTLPNNLHSTDPWVFDKSFYYSNCKQLTFHRVLKNISPGSIVAFGSRIGGSFCLDTLMVIENSMPYSPASPTENRLISAYSLSFNFQAAVLQPLAQSCGGSSFVLHKGCTYNPALRKNKQPIYSFVPCSQSGQFDRPAIKSKHINPRLSAGIKTTHMDDDEIEAEWQNIVSQIFKLNLKLGVGIS